MQNFSVVIHAVLAVFLVIFTGGLLHRKGLLGHELERGMFKIILNVLTPCFIIDSIIGNEALRNPINIISAPLIGLFLCVVAAFVGLVFAPLAGAREQSSKRSFAYAVSIMNYGFIAVPLAQSIFGKETLGMLFVFNLGIEIALWTLGAILLSRQTVLHALRQINFSVIGAIVLAVCLNFAHAQEWMPTFILKAVHLLGAPANPLAILLIGAAFASSLESFSFRTGWRTMGGGILIRNFLLPILFIMIARYAPIEEDLRRVLILQGAMPAGLYTIVIIKHYHGDATTGLRVAIASTLIGLLTIPLILKWGMSWVFG